MPRGETKAGPWEGSGGTEGLRSVAGESALLQELAGLAARGQGQEARLNARLKS